MKKTLNKSISPDEETLDKIIESDSRLRSIIKKNHPYEIKHLAIMNLPFFRSSSKTKATKKEELDKKGQAVKQFYKMK